MAQPISKFFSDLGFPLKNMRWSWGAHGSRGILLRTWEHKFIFRDRTVEVLRKPEDLNANDSFGLDERILHLRALWQGEVGGYTVIAQAENKEAQSLKIKDFRNDAIFPIERLEVLPDLSIAAILGNPVSVKELTQHIQNHRTYGAKGEFPVDEAIQTGYSTSSYKDRLPAMRAWLINIAKQKSEVTYGEVMDRFGLIFYQLRHAMGRIGHECRDAGEPILTSLIVDKNERRCSEGFRTEFGILDDAAERARCYSIWQAIDTDSKLKTEQTDVDERDQEASAIEDEFEKKVERFSLVEIRPYQRAFREAVFRACAGKCVVSGCDVPEVLEAAHLTGRSWREGHNSASDGLLLRRDFHALYDRGLLLISADGRIELDNKILSQYLEFQGAQIQEYATAT